VYSGTGAPRVYLHRLSYLLDLVGQPDCGIRPAPRRCCAAHACQSLRTRESDIALGTVSTRSFPPRLPPSPSRTPGSCLRMDAAKARRARRGYVRAEAARCRAQGFSTRCGQSRVPRVGAGTASIRMAAQRTTAPRRCPEAVTEGAGECRGEAEHISATSRLMARARLGRSGLNSSAQSVLMPGRTADQTCLLGSVKNEIGHLEAASGRGGLIRRSAPVRRKTRASFISKPQSPLFLSKTTFTIPRTRQARPTGQHDSWRALSSFGFGRDEAHMRPSSLRPRHIGRRRRSSGPITSTHCRPKSEPWPCGIHALTRRVPPGPSECSARRRLHPARVPGGRISGSA